MVRAIPHKKAIPLAVTQEAWLVVAGLVLAWVLIRIDIVGLFVHAASDFVVLTSFVVGLFFTSILTTVPAIVAFSELAQYVPIWKLALVGALGAVVGDLIIFQFIRSPLALYILRSASNSSLRKVGRVLARGPLWWTIPAFGALIIASPLPDELGLIMMGLSSIRMPGFIVLAYTMNALGIFAMAYTGQALLL